MAICLSSLPGELPSPLDQGLLEALDAVLSSLPGIQTLQVELVLYMFVYIYLIPSSAKGFQTSECSKTFMIKS